MCWVPADVNSFQSRRIILSRVAQLFNFCLTRGERSSYASTGSLNCVRSVVSVGFLLRTTFIFFFSVRKSFFFFLYSFVSWSFLFLGLYQTFSLLLSGKSSFLINTSPFSTEKGLCLDLVFVSGDILFVYVIFANMQLMFLLLTTIHIATPEMGNFSHPCQILESC